MQMENFHRVRRERNRKFEVEEDPHPNIESVKHEASDQERLIALGIRPEDAAEVEDSVRWAIGREPGYGKDTYGAVYGVIDDMGYSSDVAAKIADEFGLYRGQYESLREAKMSFDDWMKAVDDAVWAKAGLSIHDLPDVPLRDWYDSGTTPRGAASRAIKMAGAEMGY